MAAGERVTVEAVIYDSGGHPTLRGTEVNGGIYVADPAFARLRTVPGRYDAEVARTGDTVQLTLPSETLPLAPIGCD